MPDTDGTEADLLTVLEPYDRILVTGPDAALFAPVLKSVFGDSKLIITDTAPNKAVSVSLIDCALRKLEKDGPDDIGQGPVYLRKSDAEIALEERMNKIGEKTNG